MLTEERKEVKNLTEEAVRGEVFGERGGRGDGQCG